MKRSAPTFRSDLFTYSNENRSFVAEASTVTRGGILPLKGQVSDDACDEGLNITSKRTGRTARFVWCEEKYDNDGDLLVTIFKVASVDAKRYGIPSDCTVHILND